MNKATALVFLLLSFVAVRAQDSVTATPLTPTSPAVYKFNVTFNTAITAETVFEIEFPLQFQLHKVTLANSKVLGGVLQVSVQVNKVTLEPLQDKAVAAGTPIDFVLASVINAAEMNKPWKFAVNMRQNGEIAEEKIIEMPIESFSN